MFTLGSPMGGVVPLDGTTKANIQSVQQQRPLTIKSIVVDPVRVYDSVVKFLFQLIEKLKVMYLSGSANGCG